MKILVIIPDLYASGGAEMFCLRVMKEISERGHEVHILTTKEESRDIDTGQIIVHNQISRPWLLSDAPLKILEIYRKISPNVIHLMHVYPTAVWFRPISKLVKSKIVCSAMGDDIQKEESLNYGIRTNKLKNWLIKDSLKSCDKLTVFGKGMVEVAEEVISAEKINVINNAVPRSGSITEDLKHEMKSELELDESKFNILYLGRFHEKKNIQELLKAAEQLSDDYNITIVGKGETEDELKSYVSENSISNVEFKTPIYGEEKNALYRLYDLFVLPSFLEGMPTVLIEAANQDMAILGSDIPGNLSIIDKYDKGYSYQQGSSRELAEMIEKLNESESTNKGALEGDFTTEGVAENIIQIYRD